MGVVQGKLKHYDNIWSVQRQSYYIGSKMVSNYYNHLEISYLMWKRCKDLNIHPVKLTKINHVGKWRLNDYRLLLTVFGGRPRYNNTHVNKIHQWLQTLEKEQGVVLDAPIIRRLRAVLDTSTL